VILWSSKPTQLPHAVSSDTAAEMLGTTFYLELPL